MPGQLTISLAAVAANYATTGDHCGTGVAAVVKANAYGLGAIEVAQALYQAGCREFFVATLVEGERLRAQLAQAQIYVFEGARADTVQPLIAARLTPVLSTAGQFACWAATGLAAAVHIDTGMQRLGLSPESAPTLLAQADFPITLVVSHFARADEQDPHSTQQQVQRLDTALQGYRRSHADVRVSFSNSAAAMAGSVGEHLVRAGIGLYGGNPFSAGPNPMHPVVQLQGQILQVRDLPAGVPVGYGASFTTASDSRIATVGLGYADGVPRLLSNRGEVVAAGVRAPMVGRVSMDMLHVDVSDIQPQVEEGDWVEILGTTIGVDEVARHADTIGYEVLTGLDAAGRLQRHYTQ